MVFLHRVRSRTEWAVEMRERQKFISDFPAIFQAVQVASPVNELTANNLQVIYGRLANGFLSLSKEAGQGRVAAPGGKNKHDSCVGEFGGYVHDKLKKSLETLQLEIGACLKLLAQSGLADSGPNRVGSAHGVGAQPSLLLGKPDSFVKPVRKKRSAKGSRVQLGWLRKKVGDPGASSSVAGAHSRLGLLGRTLPEMVEGVSGMVDGILHVGRRQSSSNRQFVPTGSPVGAPVYSGPRQTAPIGSLGGSTGVYEPTGPLVGAPVYPLDQGGLRAILCWRELQFVPGLGRQRRLGLWKGLQAYLSRRDA